MGVLTEKPPAHIYHRPSIKKTERRRFHKFSTWKEILVSVTAYVIGRGEPCDNFPGKTSTGVQVNLQTAAVDPRVFRYGTRFKVPGMGIYTAQDSGSAIVGNHIDLAVERCQTAYSWGIRRLKIQYRT